MIETIDPDQNKDYKYSYVLLINPGVNLPSKDYFQYFRNGHIIEQYDAFYKHRFKHAKSKTIPLIFQLAYGFDPLHSSHYFKPQITEKLEIWPRDEFELDNIDSLQELNRICEHISTSEFITSLPRDIFHPSACFVDKILAYMGRPCSLTLMDCCFEANISRHIGNVSSCLSKMYSQYEFLLTQPADLNLPFGRALFVDDLESDLCFISVLSIIDVMVTTGAILVLLGWELNIIESTIALLTVGLSFDFVLHYALAFCKSSELKRTDRAVRSINEVICPVTMSMLTTFVTGLGMVFADTLCFLQIGSFMMLIAILSWLISTLFFTSMLACFEILQIQRSFHLVSQICILLSFVKIHRPFNVFEKNFFLISGPEMSRLPNEIISGSRRTSKISRNDENLYDKCLLSTSSFEQ
uniref:SSD domain-containing protein n=1 Tax=Ascaris lumbricoides TaxID=6252 RepID=A0A0M3ISC9_ASCLU